MRVLIAILFISFFFSCNDNRIGNDTKKKEKIILEDTISKTTFKIDTFTYDTCRNIPVETQETYSLRLYFPNYSNIDLICGKMPEKKDEDVIMVCAASYTSKRLNHFEHSNIIGNHVSGGNLYKGAVSNTYRGAFSFYDGQTHFSYDNWNDDIKEAVKKGGCLFAQDMMIHEGKIVKHWRKDESFNLFRALCLIDGRVAIVDSKRKISFGEFISLLLRINVTEAIYLDMGGWKHSWYRKDDGSAVDIYPPETKYGTNWITFYK